MGISVENIYYLGPNGSNVHCAMQSFMQVCNINAKNLYPQKSIKSAIENIERDFSSVCVLPIENSIEGIVRETIDNLLKISDNKIKIQGEITLPIKHLLLSTSNDLKKIKKVISHPQALAQCSKFLYKTLPDAELKEVSSTSYAAEKVASLNDETIAAIANKTCSEIFNLNVLQENINDEEDNKTRFYILSRNEFTQKNNGKTAVILSTKNQSGALCDVLKIFAKHEINLTYIDSRPSKRQLGEYLFFMELDGFDTDYKIKLALEELMAYVNFFRTLGSFQIYNQ